MLNRKQFIRNLGTLLGTLLVGDMAALGTLSNSQIRNRVAFDLHCHPGVSFMKGTDEYPGDDFFHKTVKEMLNQSLSGAFFSLVSDWPLLKRTDKGIITTYAFDKGEAWAEYKRQLVNFMELLQSLDMKIATRVEDLTHTGSLAIFLACEGGDFLGGKVDHVDKAYTDGIRSIQLVHYAQNDIGDLQTEKPKYHGLSGFGKKVVRKMNELGMVIDVAHASFKTVQDVVEISGAPIILSHSILKKDSDRPISVRAISDEHAKLISQTGGVIGAWPSGFSTSFDDFVENTLQLVEVAGIDHVGIGTDMDANYKPVIKNYSEFSQWIEALSERGLSDEEVEKLSGGNITRVLKQVLK